MNHILLIDDDPDILDIVCLELRDNPDTTVDICCTVPDALEKINETRYDIIITDWRMPIMNGTELVKTIRSSGYSSVVIIYSGLGMCAEIKEALDSGANYYLHRKGDPEKEFARLKELIAKSGVKN